MALSRRNGGRFEANIWPGFVDAMTALLLVLVFVLSIFMIMQYMLAETINSQDSELDALNSEVRSLAEALGLSQATEADLEDEVSRLGGALEEEQAELARQGALIATLTAQTTEQQGRIASFEEQVAGLLSERDGLQTRIAGVEADLERELSEKEAAQLALAQARNEVDLSAEQARLAAARSAALQAMVADLESERDANAETLAEAEANRLADAAAAEALRERLSNADAELTAMTLALEEQRREAEETLTLLAAARAAEQDLDNRLLTALSAAQAAQAELATNQNDLRARLASALAAQRKAEADVGDALTESQERAILLASARQALSEEQERSAESQRQVEVLNQQIAALRTQLGSLQQLLDDAGARDVEANVQIEALGSQLNTALAQVASEQQQRAALEAAERKRLEEEAKELKNYRSEFFGQLRSLLGDQEGVRIEGDRFVFSSEVLFDVAQADLSLAGRQEVAKVARILSAVANDIPDTLDWVIRVDGHTDNVPLSGAGRYRDNWELSQARALSVVRYMSGELGIPPGRLAANGFGEYQPVNLSNTPEARAQNRRIELKLTEK